MNEGTSISVAVDEAGCPLTPPPTPRLPSKAAAVQPGVPLGAPGSIPGSLRSQGGAEIPPRGLGGTTLPERRICGRGTGDALSIRPAELMSAPVRGQHNHSIQLFFIHF
jgi:hypothetical protein